jgi:L-amino acid N-acyltransferase YncA
MPDRYVYFLDLYDYRLPAGLAFPPGAKVRPPTPADAEALADLMIESYRGTIDYHGETLDQALADVRAYLDGVEGVPLLDCSWLCCVEEQLVAACLVGWWNERATALVYYIMTRLGWKGRGLGRSLVGRALQSLAARGEPRVAGVITEGNVPSERLFARWGFVRKDFDCIASVTATLCALLEIEPPALTRHGPLDLVLQSARAQGLSRVDKCLVYAPDALGEWLYRKYTAVFAAVQEHAPISMLLRAVMPPKTPVCFASMFTGALPEEHGIRHYERPVLRCDTLFDALLRAGKRVAIVAVKDCSIDLIFRERAMDYFSEPYDREVEERALALLERDEHDVLVVYQQAYDDALHRTTPESPEALQALRDHIATFSRIAGAFDRCWGQYRRAIFFAPDHGAHVDPATGKGTHGAPSPEDMFVRHFVGVRYGSRE